MPVVREEQDQIYESGTLTVTNGTTDYDAKNTGGLFATVTTAKYLWLKSDVAVSVKLNATTNNSRGLTAGIAGKFHRTITNFYVTNASGSDASIEYYFDN